MDVVAHAEDSSVQVTYELRAAGLGGGSTLTMAQDPPMFAMAMASPDGRMRTIVDEQRTVTCIEADGWQCFTQGYDNQAYEELFELPGLDDDFSAGELDDDHQPDRVERATLLDRDAICAWYDGLDGVAEARVCFDEQTGALLLTSGVYGDGEEFSMEAVEIGDPDSSLFEAPAEPTEFDFGG